MNYTITENTRYNSIEISFEKKPSADYIAALKSLRFRWNPKKSIWYGFSTAEEVKAHFDAIGEEEEAAEVFTTTTTDAYMGAVGYEGNNAHNYRDANDLKNQLKALFKKYGIKATIREGRGGYTTSLYFTITATPSDFVSLDEYIKKAGSMADFLRCRSWVCTFNADGTFKEYMFFEKFWTLPAEEQEKIRIDNLTHDYNQAIEGGDLDANAYTAEFNDKITLMKKIVSSFNYSDSNSQVDYFDVGFYTNYAVKVVEAPASATKAEPAASVKGVKLGDVFVTCWGYEQTNREFYQVVKLCGSSFVEVKEIRYNSHGGRSGSLSDMISFIRDDFMPNAQAIRCKVNATDWDGSECPPFIKIEGHRARLAAEGERYDVSYYA